MTPEQIEQSAAAIWQARTNARHIASLPSGTTPQNRVEGYAVQQALARLSGQQPYGWKIAATSAAGQKHIGVDGPLGGRLFINRVLPMSMPISLRGNGMKVGEVEFAFRMAADLPARAEPYRVDEVMTNVSALYPAIEIPDSRFIDFAKVGGASLIADDACAHEFILGDEVKTNWRSLDLSKHRVTVTCDREPICEGIGSNVLGDPRLALTWLANELNTYGLMLRAGETITTGTCVVPFLLQAGKRYTADFGALGTLSLSFKD